MGCEGIGRKLGWPALIGALMVAALPVCPAEGVAETRKRNLLLITLDTFRADHLSYNDSTKVQTPHLDGLARGGVNFARTRAPVPMTLPAHASILTGNYPPTHGVRDNGAYRLPQEQITLAEILKEQDYETAAFIAAFVMDRRFGLGQGFDVYDDRAWDDVAMLENVEAEREADKVHAAFSGWLKSRDGARPFFAWVHLYDPHAPYVPPEPFRSRYPDDPYAGEVAYTDAVVGRIIEDLESKKLMEDTIVAVVGDHGEGLGEHEEKTHSLLIYNSTLHVPMLIHAPGLVPARKTVSRLTRIIDLAPTLLDYLGLDHRFGHGRSLRGLIEGRDDRDVVAYSESLYPSRNLGWSELRGLEAGRFRYILAPTPELYDVKSDPGENTNLLETQPETAGRLRTRLEVLMKSMDSREERAERSLDPETEKMLRSLGYVSSKRSAGSSSAADPKDKMGIWSRIQFGIFQFGQGDYRGAVETFRGALESEKEVPLIYEYLGSCHMRLEQWSEAERTYIQAIERGMDSADSHLNLGIIHFHRRDFARAERELQAALKLDVLNVSAHYRLADVYRVGRRHGEAIEHYRKALEINPSYVYALNGLGMTLARVGRNDEALAAFRELVTIDRKGARGYFNLAVLLERMTRNTEALEAYREFMSLSTEDGFPGERRRATAAIERLEALR